MGEGGGGRRGLSVILIRLQSLGQPTSLSPYSMPALCTVGLNGGPSFLERGTASSQISAKDMNSDGLP